MKKLIRKIIIFILITSNYSIAQRQDSWTTFNTEDGLVNNTVISIIEDSEGALWFGTAGGVSKYKEGMWITFNVGNSGLADNSVRAILEDSNGALWFGTFGGGVTKYKEGIWETFNTGNSGLAHNNIRAILEDSEGALWFATYFRGKGVSRYKKGIWETFNTVNSGLADDNVNAMLEDSEGALWFGTQNGGVSKYKEGAWETFNTGNSGLANYNVQAILEDCEKALWFGTWRGGVSRYKEGIWETFDTGNSGLADNVLYAILEDSEEALWFGTVGGGVSRYEEGIWETFNTGNSGLADNNIHAMLKDSEEAFWFGTWGGGVSRYNEGIWETFNTGNSGLADNTIHAMLKDNEDALWFGTWGGGVSIYNEGAWETFDAGNSGLADNYVNAIFEDSEGAIWFGTKNGGVSSYKEGAWKTFDTRNSGLANNEVYAISEDSKKALWFGTWGGGVSRYNEGIWETFNTKNSGLADNYVKAILEDSEGALWFGNYGGGGVSIYKEGTWETFDTGNSGLANNYVNAILEDSERMLWFGTDGGVSIYKEGLWETFDTKNSGLVDNYVQAILEDSKEVIWLGTGGGVNRLKIDRNPPYIYIIKSPGRITGSYTPFFSFRGKDYQTEESKILYSYAVVDSTIIPQESDYSFFFNEPFVDLPSLQNGTYTFYVRARDKMGNVSKPTTYTFTVDITPPTLIISSPKQEQHIIGKWTIIGSAFDNSPIKDFDYYKFYYGIYLSEYQEPEWKEDKFTNLKSNEVRNDTLGIFNTIGLEDGLYQIKLWGIDTLKHESEDKVLVTIDNTKPIVEIINPKAGDKVSKKVDIYATINDVNIEKYSLEYKIVHQAKWQYLNQDTLNLSIENQLIYAWENSSDSGDVYLKLTAWDKAGNSTSDTVLFVFDNTESHLPTANILSPLNNAYVHDFVRIKGYATDKNFTKYYISLKSEKIDTLLIESDKKKENDVLFTLDTKSFPDDRYKTYLTALNDRQYQKTDSITITIDNTLPVAQIAFPSSDTISCYALIQGEANDANLKGLTLKYAKVEETDSSKYILIDTTFVYWNTMELNGYYTLYLTVEDKGGLRAIDKRTYFIYNPIFNQRTGLRKSQGEFSLYIPPNGYPASVICIEKRSIDKFIFDSEEITPTDLICEIHSSIEESQFNKPAVFTIDYNDIDVSQFDKSKLRVFSWENDNWNLVGGTLEEDNKVITTAINRIGIYGLFECKKTIEAADKGLQVDCQPRMFSPRGGGYSTETDISFYLGKDSDVTIKIFNMAGRLVNTLCENKFMTSGMNSVAWDGKDSSGRYCISGLYVVLIEAEEKNATKTMMVLNK